MLGEVGDLGAIDGVELGEDPPHEDLDGAFADVELMGDALVGLSLAQPSDNLYHSRA